MAANASKFTVQSVFNSDNKRVKEILECSECGGKNDKVVMLQCFHIVCYSNRNNCLAKTQNLDYRKCKECDYVTPRQYLENKGVLIRDSAISKLYNDYITSARQIREYVYERKKHDAPIICNGLTRSTDKEEKGKPRKEHNLTLSEHMLIHIGTDSVEFFCDLKPCAKKRADELQMKLLVETDEFKGTDWRKDWPVISRRFRKTCLDDVAKVQVERIYENFNLLQKRVLHANNTARGFKDDSDRLGVVAGDTSFNASDADIERMRQARKTLAKELKSPKCIWKQPLNIMCNLGLHLILQDIMLTWSFIDGHERHAQTAKSFLEGEYGRFHAYNCCTSVTCYKHEFLKFFEGVLFCTPIYYLPVGKLCSNYRVMSKSPVFYFYGVGTKQTPEPPRTDNTVQLLVKKQPCDCRVLEQALKSVKDKGYYGEGVVRLLEKDGSVTQTSHMWTTKLDRSLLTYTKISERCFIKSSRDHLRLTMANDQDVQGFDLFRDSMANQQFARGVWYFNEDDTYCTVFALEIGSRNVMQFELTSEFPQTDLRPGHFARKRILQLDPSEEVGRNFHHKDTLAVTRASKTSPLTIAVCYFREDTTQQLTPIDKFIKIYQVQGDKLQFQRQLNGYKSDGFGEFLSPVILGISEEGRNFLILDEVDSKWLHLYQQTSHADLDKEMTSTCLKPWKKMQIQRPGENEGMVILDAFFVCRENNLLLHICTPASATPAENIRQTEYFQLDITELMNPQQSAAGPGREAAGGQ